MTDAKISRKQQILHALMEMLEDPNVRITTAALAKRVGVSEAALYRHFASKAQMFDALIEFVEDTVFSRAKMIQQQELGALAKCQQILTLLLTFVERNAGISRILTGEALTGENERLGSRVNQLFEKLETQLKQILREAELREGLRTQDTPTSSANLLLAVAEGRIRQYSRTNFRHKPTATWADQWAILSQNLMR
jgi:TetR/AcrR family transcriptional regulator|tara:strand:- start:2772 stop:3356 length:585 start_codon:yes stop_codon:yes gene_type:complete